MGTAGAYNVGRQEEDYKGEYSISHFLTGRILILFTGCGCVGFS